MLKSISMGCVAIFAVICCGPVTVNVAGFSFDLISPYHSKNLKPLLGRVLISITSPYAYDVLLSVVLNVAVLIKYRSKYGFYI